MTCCQSVHHDFVNQDLKEEHERETAKIIPVSSGTFVHFAGKNVKLARCRSLQLDSFI